MTKLGDIHFRQPLANKRTTPIHFTDQNTGEPNTTAPEELFINTTVTPNYAILNEAIADNSATNFDYILYGTSVESATKIYPNDSSYGYTVNETTSVIEFTTLPSGVNIRFWACYKGIGSIVWAEDVTSLQEATLRIDNETLYKDGSVTMTGALAMGNNNINNVNNINVNGTVDGVDISAHNHSGGSMGTPIDANGLADNSVTTSKIANVNVTNDKIVSLNGSKLIDSSVEYSKLTNSAVDLIANAIFNKMYKKGSIYITTASTCPIPVGNWQLVSQGRVLQGVSSGQTAGNTVEAGLPNITGTLSSIDTENISSGAFYVEGTHRGNESIDYRNKSVFKFDASRSSSIYKNNFNTVQPPAYLVNIFQRTDGD
jgi:hypothetical protein